MSNQLKYLLLLFLVFSGVALHSQDVDYAIKDIDSTMKKADAVIRFDNAVLEIKSKQKAIYTDEEVISILSPEAESMATIFDYYSDRSSITGFKAWVMDANGKVIKKFNRSDASDYSAGGEYVDDHRVKVWRLNIINPPFTIHYILEESYTSTYQLPGFQPVRRENVGGENLKFKVLYDASTPVHYRARHVHQTDSTNNILAWEVKNFKPVKSEQYATPMRSLLPSVTIMPEDYKLFNKEGTATTWSDVGKFFSDLNGSGRDELQEVTDPTASAIINSGTDKLTKAKELYKYLQNNYRYVGIELDLAGWQAQTAQFTMQKKYGDCKALSILMKALLQKAGVTAYATLINATDNAVEVEKDFPSSNFNHVILCVPMQPDTLWLECTSQTSPFNYLGSFTANRNALLTYTGGGQIIHTPVYDEKCNISHSTSEITWRDDNTTIIQAQLEKEDELQESLRGAIDRHNEKNIESAIINSVHAVNTKINSYKIINLDTIWPKVSLTVQLSNQSTIKKTASRLFVRTDIFKPISFIPENKSGRTQKVHTGRGFTQYDTLIYHIPPGYQPENFKANDKQEVSTRFGNTMFETAYDNAANEIKICRSFCLKHGTYPAEDFADFRDFLLKGTKTFCPELVLKKVE